MIHPRADGVRIRRANVSIAFFPFRGPPREGGGAGSRPSGDVIFFFHEDLLHHNNSSAPTEARIHSLSEWLFAVVFANKTTSDRDTFVTGSSGVLIPTVVIANVVQIIVIYF